MVRHVLGLIATAALAVPASGWSQDRPAAPTPLEGLTVQADPKAVLVPTQPCAMTDAICTGVVVHALRKVAPERYRQLTYNCLQTRLTSMSSSLKWHTGGDTGSGAADHPADPSYDAMNDSWTAICSAVDVEQKAVKAESTSGR